MAGMQKVHVECDREADGRYIADVTDYPGVMAYGATEGEACTHALALLLRVIADRLENGEGTFSGIDVETHQPGWTRRISRRARS